jgi:hypothetical protein
MVSSRGPIGIGYDFDRLRIGSRIFRQNNDARYRPCRKRGGQRPLPPEFCSSMIRASTLATIRSQ